MTTIHTRAPCRLSLGGGGTDVSPYTEQHGGAVTNFAIDLYMEASLRLRDDQEVLVHSISGEACERFSSLGEAPDTGPNRLALAIARRLHTNTQGFELRYYAPIPERSGLGGSAALAAAIAGTFNRAAMRTGGDPLDSYALAECIYGVERTDLGNLGGRQDQYAAIFGGVNFIEFSGDAFVRVNPLRPPVHVMESLQRELLLLWIGDRSASGGIIEEQARNVAAGGDALTAMHEAKAMARDVKRAILEGRVDALGVLLHDGWTQKKRFGAGITNTRIDALYEALRAVGMSGGKITGAGGGGHMLVCAPFDRRADVLRVAREAGARHVPYRIDPVGMVTWEAPT
jgi:D-glycero-alpha-D-manno-heptose-7-phosphate kinase